MVMEFTPMTMQYATMLIASAIVMHKSISCASHTCKLKLYREQSLTIGISLVSLFQIIAALNYLIFVQGPILVYGNAQHGLLLGGIVLVNTINYLVLDTFSKYKRVRKFINN